MEYETKSDLPETLREVLPDNAQEIFLQAYQEAWADYEEGERGEMSRSTVANQHAWAALKNQYIQDKKSGTWYGLGEGPDRENEGNGIFDRLKDALGI